MSNSGHYSVMQDRDTLYDLYWNQRKSLTQIAKIYNVPFQTVGKWLKRLNVPSRPYSTKGFKFPGRKVSEEVKNKLRILHTGKKLSPEHAKKVTKNLLKYAEYRSKDIGEVVESHDGYKKIKVAKGKWVYLHRHIVEQRIGRKLSTKEAVHHLNLDPSDNRLDNLALISSADHLNFHSVIGTVARRIFRVKYLLLSSFF